MKYLRGTARLTYNYTVYLAIILIIFLVGLPVDGFALLLTGDTVLGKHFERIARRSFIN